MGIAIHLRGRLRDAGEVSRLVDEVSDIADTLRWPHKVIEDGDLCGIVVTPHRECEPLMLVFDGNGVLRNPDLPRDEAFLLEIHDRLRKQEAPPPVVDYLCACASSAVVGVRRGRYWSRENGFTMAQTARYAIAAERFATVARLLGNFAVAGLEGMADRARKISAGFRAAATEGPGGKLLG